MRALVLAFLLASTGAWGLAPAPTDAQAQLAHSRGSCGSWGPGTGLGPDGRGWIVSMLPGRHEFRVVGEGTAGVTYQHLMVMDFNAGQPYEFTMVSAPAGWSGRSPAPIGARSRSCSCTPRRSQGPRDSEALGSPGAPLVLPRHYEALAAPLRGPWRHLQIANTATTAPPQKKAMPTMDPKAPGSQRTDQRTAMTARSFMESWTVWRGLDFAQKMRGEVSPPARMRTPPWGAGKPPGPPPRPRLPPGSARPAPAPTAGHQTPLTH